MTPDLDQAATFLSALDPNGDRFTFQYFRDREGSIIRARHIHARLLDVAHTLAKVNVAGGGIFVTVNRTDGRGRTAANVTDLRSLFIDCDGPRARPLALPPSMSVETSPMRGHHYWLLAPGEPLDSFRGAQEALANYYHTDTTVTDLGRVLRLPGFWNMKHEPFPVRLIRCNTNRRYTIAEILAAHRIEVDPRTPGAPARRCVNGTCAEIVYRRWARRAPLTVGHRNRVAFRLAVEGFQAGLDPDAIAREVRAYCERAGIGAEATAVLRSAARATARTCRHSSPIAECATQSQPEQSRYPLSRSKRVLVSSLFDNQVGLTRFWSSGLCLVPRCTSLGAFTFGLPRTLTPATRRGSRRPI